MKGCLVLCSIAAIVLLAFPVSPSAASAGLPVVPGFAAPSAPSWPALPVALTNKTVFVRQGLVVPLGSPGAWDDYQVGRPSVLLDGGVYKMWYFGSSLGSGSSIGYATSPDGRSWTKAGPVLTPTLPAEGSQVMYPTVVKVASGYWMWYNGWDGATWTVLAANSTDGVSWTKLGAVFGAGSAGSPDEFAALFPDVLYDAGTFRMYYTGRSTYSDSSDLIMLATSPDGVNWTRAGVVLTRGSAGSNDAGQAAFASVVKSGTSYDMAYTGRSSNGTTFLLTARSVDGLAWQKIGVALTVLPPNENLVAAPALVELANGTSLLYYNGRSSLMDLQVYLAAWTPPSPPGTGTTNPTGGISLELVFLVVLIVGPAVVLGVVGALWIRRRSRSGPYP